MRICVYGAGATVGNFATRLAAAGNEVSVAVRGAHLDAIRANGLTMHWLVPVMTDRGGTA